MDILPLNTTKFCLVMIKQLVRYVVAVVFISAYTYGYSQQIAVVTILPPSTMEHVFKFDYKLESSSRNLKSNLLITPDGKQILYAKKGNVFLVNTATGISEFTFTITSPYALEIEQILLSSDGKLLYARTSSQVTIWDIETQQLISNWNFSDGDPQDGLFLNNNKHVFNDASFFDIKSGQKLHGPISLRDYKQSVISLDSEKLFTFDAIRSKEQTLYNVRSGEIKYLNLKGRTEHAIFTNDSKILFVTHKLGGLFARKDNGQAISAVDAQSGKTIDKLNLSSRIMDLAISKNDKILIVSLILGDVYLYNTDNYEIASQYQLNFTSSMFVDNSGKIWFGAWDNQNGKIGFYEPKLNTMNLINKPTGKVEQVVISQNNTYIAYRVLNNKNVTVHVERIAKK